VAPLFILLVFGIIEVGRAIMVQQLLINATREGARQAVLPSATVDSVKESVIDYLDGASIDVSAENVTVTPDPAEAVLNERITVVVEVPYSDVSWIPSFYLERENLRASTSMRSERFQ
jgi:Flp pilus assembly protein TadG